MSEPDVPLTAEFEPPTREAWLTLVEKALKGGDFEKRLVSRTADGLAIQPLYTRQDESKGAAPAGRTGWFPGGWDVRQRHIETDPKAANAAILEDLMGGGTSVLLQIQAPGQAGLNYGAEALAQALKGVYLNACTIALDARENTLDAAGSLLEIWRTEGINENDRRGAFNYDPLGVLAKTGTLYYPPDRSCEIAAKLAADSRTMSHVRALIADGRPYHEAGGSEAQELAAILATLVAYLRACETAGLQAAHGAGPDRDRPGGRCRPVPDHGQDARRAPSGEPGRGCLRCRHGGGEDAIHGHHLGAHDGQARSVGEHAAHHGGLRRRGVRRGRRDHRAALHLGARTTGCLCAPHRPQHAPGAAGGKLGGTRDRSRRTAPGTSRR